VRRVNLVAPSRYALAADVQTYRSAGSSTSQFVLGRHLLSFLSGFSKLSRDERPDGSLPAFAWGDVAHAQPLSASLQDRLRFFRPPLPAVPSPSLAVRIPREVGLNGLTQLTTAELRASPVGATLPVGQWMSLPAGISDSPPHVPFGHGLQPLGPFLTHERGSPFACAQPSGASLGRFCLEASRLRPLSP
jgi:hypothetical protein